MLQPPNSYINLIVLPEINIYYSNLLNKVFEEAIRRNKGSDWEAPSKDFHIKKVEGYKKEWGVDSEKILSEISRVLGLEFRENLIDVHIVVGRSAMSDPLVIGSDTKEEDFVSVLTHELIHRLLNKSTSNIDLVKIWSNMFPGVEDVIYRNHILVHAVHKYIYVDLLEDKDLLEKNIEKDKGNEPYAKSWAFVEENGYKNIIEDFKSRI